jgi:serine/threonine protein kinase
MSEPGADGRPANEGDPDARVVQWAAEIADRIQAGEPVDPEEIAHAHPDQAAALRRLLPAIEMMAALGSDRTARGDDGRPSSTDPERPPEILGDFELVRELGRGGMGIVYEARQLSLGGRRVAVKILSAAAALDPRQSRRFQVEVQAAACLDHEHIVPVYSVGHERGVPFYVMRLIEGRSLAQIVRELRRAEGHEGGEGDEGDAIEPDALATTLTGELASGRLLADRERPAQGGPMAGGTARPGRPRSRHRTREHPPPAAAAASTALGSSSGDRAYFRSVARLAMQASEALDYAHREGVLHRDIKPGNLLVDLRGHLWVADFGLARLRGNSELTRTGDLIGTLRYMSPEQALARRVPVDHRTDVYSLGATIYEMLTLRPAFPGEDRTQILRRIAEEEPRPPRRLNRRIPRDLETVVLKAMAKEPARRYQSAGELTADLERFLDGLPVLARRSPIWRKAVAWVRTHRMTAALIVAVVAVLLIATSAWTGLRRARSESLFRRLESARLVDLPELVPDLDLSDRSVVDRLGRLFTAGDPAQRLAAAVALAPIRKDCRDEALDRLLDGDPDQLKTLAPLLRKRIPEALESRLAAEGGPAAPAGGPPGAAADHRRANAACARILLGLAGSSWSLLESAPDPQARSFFIKSLGPAGIDPRHLIARVDDPSMGDSARAAAILAIEAIPAESWAPGVRDAFTRRLLGLYRDDPHVGVHGAAKWLLARWGMTAEMGEMDRELAGTRADDPRFKWRIGREGLTLVTVDDPTVGRVIEVSDCEITVEMFRHFRPGFEYSREFSDEADCPINSPSYYDASAFCNWLSGREGIPPDQECYRPTGMKEPPYLPVPGHLELTGFRLPTAKEFDVFCAAGTRTRRFFGDSDLLLDRHAWTHMSRASKAQTVAATIPNDLGVFDTLGNIQEWCEADVPVDSDGRYTADLRGGWFGRVPASGVDRGTAFHNVYQNVSNPMNGFRVVRTRSVR